MSLIFYVFAIVVFSPSPIMQLEEVNNWSSEASYTANCVARDTLKR